MILWAIQWIILAFNNPAYYSIPLYLVAWVVPAVVIVQAVREIDSGLWSEARASRLRTRDLWWSRLFPPMAPWLVSLFVLTLPAFGKPYGALEGKPTPDLTIGHVHLYLWDANVWGYVAGVQACAFAYGALGLWLALRFRRVRSALVGTYMVSGAIAYVATAMDILRPVLGEWARMQALTYVAWVEPWVILAPPWMVGGSLYSLPSEYVHRHIVPVTGAFFLGAAFLTMALSYYSVARERRARARERF